jgi:hypothetical protein
MTDETGQAAPGSFAVCCACATERAPCEWLLSEVPCHGLDQLILVAIHTLAADRCIVERFCAVAHC